MSEEKRIYVVVAETVQTAAGSIVQPCGRIAAQCAHVVSKMRLALAKQSTYLGWEPFTTIVLAARDSKEMFHIEQLMHRDSISHHNFEDTNLGVYGPGDVLTAMCTEPIENWLLAGVTDYLPLWNHGANL